MKILKTLITLTLLNVAIVMASVSYLSQKPLQSAAEDVSTEVALDVSPMEKTTVPTGISAPAANNATPTIKPKPKVVTTVKPTNKPATTTATPTPKTAATQTATPTPTPKPAPSGCIIKIDGVSYEITSLRKSHSGGDIFSCSTDMSAIFWGKHNAKILAKMAQYKI